VLDEQTILNGDTLTLSTDLGPLEIVGTPDGTRGFADLAAHQEVYAIAPDLTVAVASIPDLIRMKRASSAQPHRTGKDLDDIEALTALDELRRT
jgi:predicted nucleotidyltransferase